MSGIVSPVMVISAWATTSSKWLDCHDCLFSVSSAVVKGGDPGKSILYLLYVQGKHI